MTAEGRFVECHAVYAAAACGVDATASILVSRMHT